MGRAVDPVAARGGDGTACDGRNGRFDRALNRNGAARPTSAAPAGSRGGRAPTREGSLCFGVYDGTRQVGFARVITDGATFAYLADVFVLESHRGRGLAVRLMDAVIAHPRLQGLRRWVLATQDAHGLYAKFGFTALAVPDRFMERHDPTVYGAATERPPER